VKNRIVRAQAAKRPRPQKQTQAAKKESKNSF
jgi:hypothetical protein